MGGRVPFADVAFDVGPPTQEEGATCASDPSEQGRFLAHRIVVGAQSAVLLEELGRLPTQLLVQENIHACILRVDARISKEVWRCVLQFLYKAEVRCSFA